MIGLFFGQKNTGGYSINIHLAYESEDEIIFAVSKYLPGEFCGVTLALTSPSRAYVIPNTSKKISFVSFEEVYDCMTP